MLDEKDLQAIATLIDSKLDAKLTPIEKRLDGIDSRLERIEENTEVTREAVNTLLEWAENVSNAIRFPLPKL